MSMEILQGQMWEACLKFCAWQGILGKGLQQTWTLNKGLEAEKGKSFEELVTQMFNMAGVQGLPTPSQNLFVKVSGTSLRASPCKRASILPAAWIEQEAGSPVRKQQL